MKNYKIGSICVVVMAVLAIAGLWHINDAFGQQGGGGGFGGGPGGFGGGSGGGSFGTTSSVASNADFVYVLQNDTLTQLAAKDMTEVRKIELKLAVDAVADNSKKASQGGAARRGGGQGGGFGGGQGGGGGGQGGGGGFGGGPGGFGGGSGGGMFGTTSSITANAEFVYVLQNNTLTQLSAYDLKQVKQLSIDPSSPPTNGKAGNNRSR